MPADAGDGGGGQPSGLQQIINTATLEAEGENDWTGESGASNAWWLGQTLWNLLMPINVGAMIDLQGIVGGIG